MKCKLINCNADKYFILCIIILNVFFSAAGQVGLIGCNMRSSNEAYIGDTVYKTNTNVEPLEGFGVPKPMVFAGVYPFDQAQHVSLRSAIEKLTLNDSAVSTSIDSRYIRILNLNI